MYDGTAPEQKTKSAKNGLDSMSKPFFHNPSECNKLHPPPFAREAKRLIYFYSARFSHFIDSLKGRNLIPSFLLRFEFQCEKLAFHRIETKFLPM